MAEPDHHARVEVRRRGAPSASWLNLLRRPILLVGIFGLVAVAGVFVATAPAALAMNGTPLRIVTPGDGGPLNSGGSATQFDVALPAATTHCRGDSAHTPEYVSSGFLLPAGTNPANVEFTDIGPDRGLPMIEDDNIRPYADVLLERDTGRILLPPFFVWSRWGPADLFAHGAQSASWIAGIACIRFQPGHRFVDQYWSTDVTFTASSRDPGGFTWSAARSGKHSSGGNSVPWPAVFVVAIVIAAGVVTVRRQVASRKYVPSMNGEAAVTSREEVVSHEG
jgi:hypothetical protein